MDQVYTSPVGKAQLLAWAAHISDLPTKGWSSIKDGVICLQLFHSIWPNVADLASTDISWSPQSMEAMEANWAVITQYMEDLGIPTNIVDFNKVIARDAKSIYNLLVMLFFLQNLSVNQAFSVDFKLPVEPLLADFLQSPASIECLITGGAGDFADYQASQVTYDGSPQTQLDRGRGVEAEREGEGVGEDSDGDVAVETERIPTSNSVPFPGNSRDPNAMDYPTSSRERESETEASSVQDIAVYAAPPLPQEGEAERHDGRPVIARPSLTIETETDREREREEARERDMEREREREREAEMERQRERDLQRQMEQEREMDREREREQEMAKERAEAEAREQEQREREQREREQERVTVKPVSAMSSGYMFNSQRYSEERARESDSIVVESDVPPTVSDMPNPTLQQRVLSDEFQSPQYDPSALPALPTYSRPSESRSDRDRATPVPTHTHTHSHSHSIETEVPRERERGREREMQRDSGEGQVAAVQTELTWYELEARSIACAQDKARVASLLRQERGQPGEGLEWSSPDRERVGEYVISDLKQRLAEQKAVSARLAAERDSARAIMHRDRIACNYKVDVLSQRLRDAEAETERVRHMRTGADTRGQQAAVLTHIQALSGQINLEMESLMESGMPMDDARHIQAELATLRRLRSAHTLEIEELMVARQQDEETIQAMAQRVQMCEERIRDIHSLYQKHDADLVLGVAMTEGSGDEGVVSDGAVSGQSIRAANALRDRIGELLASLQVEVPSDLPEALSPTERSLVLALVRSRDDLAHLSALHNRVREEADVMLRRLKAVYSAVSSATAPADQVVSTLRSAARDDTLPVDIVGALTTYLAENRVLSHEVKRLTGVEKFLRSKCALFDRRNAAMGFGSYAIDAQFLTRNAEAAGQDLSSMPDMGPVPVAVP
ncbi:hypothetical protein KIPB_000864, partial [Kipferlia bialata]|eukprot:g864.t1